MIRSLQRLSSTGGPVTAAEFIEAIGLWDSQPVARRPRVVAAMIGSADGRATVDGGAGGLGSPADRDMLRELRAVADALLVGPGTLIAERYATLLDPEQQQRRIERGRPAEPLMATISRSLDPRLRDVPLFAEPGVKIQVYTESEGPSPGAGADVSVERVVAGSLDAATCLTHLAAAHGVRLVVTEGGPTLLHALIAEGLVDDLVLTVAPFLVAGDGRSVLHGVVFDPPVEMRLCDVMRGEDHLFLRYELSRPAAA